MPLPCIVQCPHCEQPCEIIELNCRIFRCGMYKHNYEQIPPHSSKEVCDELKKRDVIFGCGKPFLIPENPDPNAPIVAVICEYI